jgi:hypothetical protein
MTLQVLVLAALLWPAIPLSQASQTATIHGTVVDAQTTKPIADAQVFLVEIAKSVITGADGRFEFPGVKPGTHTLTVSRIGYIFVRRRVPVSAGVVLDINVPLAEGTGTYQETVTVAAAPTAPPVIPGLSSQFELGSAGLQDLRGVVADDPMRAVQALPGVATGDDFQASFSVRGSAYRHVGIVLDSTPTAALLHSVQGREDTGSVAMINTDVLSRASLLAGPHPQLHGDWLGATLDFDVREGSRDRVGFRAAVSGTSASAIVEGPIGTGKRGSWLVSTRKSYLDWLVRKIEPEVDSTIGFADGVAKAVFDVTSHHQVQLLMVGGRATYREQNPSAANGLQHAESNSSLASIAWRYFAPNVVVTPRVSIVGNDFDNRGVAFQQLGRGFTQAIAARLDATATIGAWTLEAGARRERYRMNQILRDFTTVPGTAILRVRNQRDLSAKVTTWSGWAGLSRRWTNAGLNFGMRVSDRTLASESAASPWMLGEYAIGRLTMRASAGMSAQYPELGLYGIGAPSVLPERATSFDVGGEFRITPGVRLSVTGFHRSEENVLRRIGEDRLDPVTGARIVASPFPEYAPNLDGASRGVDVTLMRRGTSGLTGWVAYTWAHTNHDDVVSKEHFDADYDQRHTLNVVAEQRLSYRFSVIAKLRMGSNMPIIGYFDGTPPDALALGKERNQVRLPTYARLDVRANRTFTFDRGRLTLFVEVMNLWGRTNYGQADGSVRANLQAVNFVERLIPFVPSAGFLIEF